MIEIITLLIIGILIGIITGLLPGIHINLIAALLISNLPALSFLSPLSIISLIVGMSLSHVIHDFIPSVFLGLPGEESFLAVLPGHKLLLQGLGLQAVNFLLVGAIISIPILTIISLFYFTFLQEI